MSRKRKVPTVEYANGVDLFTMHGMQRVVYAKSLKVVVYCLLLSERIWRHRVRCDWLKG